MSKRRTRRSEPEVWHFWLYDSESRTYAQYREVSDRAELVRVQAWRPELELDAFMELRRAAADRVGAAREAVGRAMRQPYAERALMMAEAYARGWLESEQRERQAFDRGEWSPPTDEDLARLQKSADGYVAHLRTQERVA